MNVSLLQSFWIWYHVFVHVCVYMCMYVCTYVCKRNTLHSASYMSCSIPVLTTVFFQTTISLLPKLSAYLHTVMQMAANSTVFPHNCQLEVSVWEFWSKEPEETLTLQSCEVWRNEETISFPLHTISWWAAVGHTIGAVDIPIMAHWLASGNFCHYHKSCLLVVDYEYVCMHISLNLGAFTKLWKTSISLSCLFVRPSAWNNSDPTERIFMKFDIWLFERSSLINIWQE